MTNRMLHTKSKRILADMHTPVSAYMKLRDKFEQVVLLEGTDFHAMENCSSFIGLNPIATISVEKDELIMHFGEMKTEVISLAKDSNVPQLINDFISSFKLSNPNELQAQNGFFGYTSFDAVEYFDTIELDRSKRHMDLPVLRYDLYEFVLFFDHFKDELTLIQNSFEERPHDLQVIEDILQNQALASFGFNIEGDERSNLGDSDFLEMVKVAKQHCQLGDVFQLVVSRQFSQRFSGDEFNVYRALRTINPSPYLFYFDYGNYKIFGSSPEAQIVIKDSIASVNPIAGTYKRTGNMEQDELSAKALLEDPKENAEHIMLVDLARNDLGKHSERVEVAELKDVQYFSHVIHLVSKVEGKIASDANPYQIFADTFPAGTLSGAPKYKALQLIDQHENQNRGIYGGAIGYISLHGQMNQAIVIRSFYSKNNKLYYQAGAGIVSTSDAQKEMEEVHNKLGALKSAIAKAQKNVSL